MWRIRASAAVPSVASPVQGATRHFVETLRRYLSSSHNASTNPTLFLTARKQSSLLPCMAPQYKRALFAKCALIHILYVHDIYMISVVILVLNNSVQNLLSNTNTMYTKSIVFSFEATSHSKTKSVEFTPFGYYIVQPVLLHPAQ